jgi:hypothetical protein
MCRNCPIWITMVFVFTAFGVVSCTQLRLQPLAISACPRLAEWPDERQARAADELDTLPADAELRRVVADYLDMRAQTKECRM